VVTKNNRYANLHFDTPNLSIIADKRHLDDVQSLNKVIGKEKTAHDLRVKVVVKGKASKEQIVANMKRKETCDGLPTYAYKKGRNISTLTTPLVEACPR
jgi:hypothetical protein